MGLTLTNLSEDDLCDLICGDLDPYKLKESVEQYEKVDKECNSGLYSSGSIR